MQSGGVTDPVLTAAAFTERYYTERALAFGATPFGVDWSCIATQHMRFAQLLQVCDFTWPFKLNDLGCGYGALVDYLVDNHKTEAVDYAGVDLSGEMIRLARQRHPQIAERFQIGNRHCRSACYTVLSGIFNVRSSQTINEWEKFVEATLHQVAATSKRGFAVNFLLPQAAALTVEQMSDGQLYTSNAERWIRHCEQQFSATVKLVGGYGLLEFTLLVRPSDPHWPSSAWARSSNGR